MLKNAIGLTATGVFLRPGWTVFRKEPGMAVRLCPGWTVFRKEPGMAVRLCPGWTVFRKESQKAVSSCPRSTVFHTVTLLLCLSSTSHATGNYFDYSPFETRDQNLLNLIHGQAMPTNALLLKNSNAVFSSSLVITNTLNKEQINSATQQESIYLDYEAYRLNLSYQYAVSRNINLKLDIPLIHQSGGIFDSAIDRWHQFWGLPRGSRPLVEHNQYDIQYDFQSQSVLNLNEASTSLGDIQFSAARTLIENKNTAASIWLGLKLPTGSEDKLTSNGAIDISAWLAVNQRLNEHWLINANTGVVLPGKSTYKNIPLSDQTLYGHVMLAWLVTDNINLKLQLQGHTSYYRQSQLNLLGDTYFLTFGGAYNLNNCQQLDFAFSEDIKVEASPDASLIISWRSFIGEC